VSKNKTGLGNAIGKTILGGVLLAFIIVSVLTVTVWPTGPIAQFTTSDFGATLFGTYGVVVLVLGLLLFAAMIAGVFIAQEEEQ
jgi:NADH:ubiquinone oxidoreductase subunit 6 (subunit J)